MKIVPCIFSVYRPYMVQYTTIYVGAPLTLCNAMMGAFSIADMDKYAGSVLIAS
jgi:hypothetical protein